MRFAASPGFQNAMDAISANSVDYNALTGMGQKSRSLQRQTAFDSEAKLESAANQAEAMIESAKYGAQAMRAQGQAAGNASMVSGIASGISGLAGGIGSMGGGSSLSASTLPYNSNLTVAGMTPSQVLTSDMYKVYNPLG